ncbi:centrosomal protein of 152 kDa isoform X2 [Esox lucius]|uniref:centrosomal protein of 152 kDa isoform X2 n=1 Tax=Esox lucius TaxID=8010 RepID=UPI0014776714|nr:centrosomal protein of 152 kDa isoform X2 [Esox lucius]XP_010882015.2 centrosomal protein of 152 kDa isoform X2 [Esox lucius]
MSIDFDSAALQTQHEEEEYDPEDYAREQELHKLLTDLPDDMLEDSRDCSSPELDSPCNQTDARNRQQPTWNQPLNGWSDHQTPASHEEHYEEDYENASYHDEYPYESETVAGQINGHAGNPQQGYPLAPTWDQPEQEYQQDYQPFDPGEGFAYTGVSTEQSLATDRDLSVEDGYAGEPYPHGSAAPGAEYQQRTGVLRDVQRHAGAQNIPRKHFQKFTSEASGDHYKASYNPYQLDSQAKMFNTEVPLQHQDGNFDQLQREFLDSAQKTADSQQLAQIQILNKAQLRQIEDLERKLEDSRRSVRYLEHQFAIVKDEKEGLGVSLKESGRLLEDAQEREVQLQASIKTLELQVQALNDRDHENVKNQRAAEAAVDSLQQQMAELCRSESLARVREQHDRDLTVVREQHDAKLLVLQQRLDAADRALDEQAVVVERLQAQLKQQERQREEEQVEKAGVVNSLTQCLEDSQRRCAGLLQTGSVQEMGQLQVKLQQSLSAKTMTDNMNRALQEELSDLKEQICLYESAVKHGVISLERKTDNCSWEKQLSDSYVDLGIKRSNWKNGRLHSTPLVEVSEASPQRSGEKDDWAVRELRAELQRCLASLKGKRQRIDLLQEELREAQGQVRNSTTNLKVGQLQTQLDQAKTITTAETPLGNPASQNELSKLEEDRQRLQEHVEILENRNAELKQSEEKVKAANLELCTKMREMIQELDQEKQEAAERHERTQQQFRDDVVNRVRSDLAREHTAQVEHLTAENQQHLQLLQAKVTEVNEEMLAVQECYISVCKEKDRLEENLRATKVEEEKRRENELKTREESRAALEKLRADLEAENQVALTQLRAQWAKEKDAELERLVQTQLAVAGSNWRKEKEKAERSWALRLEEAVAEARRQRATNTKDSSSQTSSPEEEKACQTLSPEEEKACQTLSPGEEMACQTLSPGEEMACQTLSPGEPKAGLVFSREELEARLGEQRLQLKQEADVAQCRAVEDAGKRVQRELQEKHLEDMARQVEGAVTRAYCRWLEDLTSLPQYKAALQRERERWEKEQEPHLQQRVSLALRAAEEQWLEERHRSREGEKEAEGDHRVEELQEEVLRWRQLEEDLKEEVEEVAHLQSQVDDLQSLLDHERVQKATLLKAELAAARASWNRDKQQEISTLQAFQQEQLRRAQEKAQEAKEEVQKLAREEAERMSKELLQKEAELKQALRSREEEWRCLEESRGQEQRKRGREEAWSEVLQEFHVGLKEVQAVLLNGGPYKEKNKVGEVDGRRPSGSVKDLLMSTCKDLLSEAVTKAKKDWKKVSEERLGRLLKDTQERHKKEIECIKNSPVQKSDGGVCGEQCAETRAKLQKKSQDLQKHLEKACRQLQAAVKEHKASMRRLKEDHEIALRREKEDSLQKLEEVKRSAAKGHSGVSDVDQSLHAGLEEMKGQYLKAVEKIRGDMLRYLQESKERAAEMIRVEVLRERQDTARKMRRYYLACLQELLEDGGQATGAEKKIINAASKLAAMAKVLETPTKRETGKSYSLPLATGLSLKTHASTASSRTRQSGSASSQTQQSAAIDPPETSRNGAGEGRGLTWCSADPAAAEKASPSRRPIQDRLTNEREKVAPADTAGQPHLPPPGHFLSLPHRPSHQIGQNSTLASYHGDFTNVTLRNQSSRELYLEGVESGRSDDDNFLCHRSNSKPFLIQEEHPVRDERRSNDWSLSNDGCQDGPRVLAGSSYPGRKMDTVKSFPLCAPSSTDNLGRFGCYSGSLTVDNSDITVYKDMVNVNIQSCTKALTFPSVPPQSNDLTQSVPGMTTLSGRSAHRYPVPGSEGGRQDPFQNRLGSKSQFSELKLSQQPDSGFESPFSQQK